MSTIPTRSFARRLLASALALSVTFAPVASAQPTPPPPTPTTTTSTSTPTSPRPPASTSTAPLFAKVAAITGGIGAAVGLLAYAGKVLIDSDSTFSAGGAALAGVGGAVGALAIGSLAFFGTMIVAMGVGTGKLDTKTTVFAAGIIGAVIGAVAFGLLGGHLGDKWFGDDGPRQGGMAATLGGSP